MSVMSLPSKFSAVGGAELAGGEPWSTGSGACGPATDGSGIGPGSRSKNGLVGAGGMARNGIDRSCFTAVLTTRPGVAAAEREPDLPAPFEPGAASCGPRADVVAGERPGAVPLAETARTRTATRPTAAGTRRRNRLRIWLFPLSGRRCGPGRPSGHAAPERVSVRRVGRARRVRAGAVYPAYMRTKRAARGTRISVGRLIKIRTVPRRSGGRGRGKGAHARVAHRTAPRGNGSPPLR